MPGSASAPAPHLGPFFFFGHLLKTADLKTSFETLFNVSSGLFAHIAVHTVRHSLTEFGLISHIAIFLIFPGILKTHDFIKFLYAKAMFPRRISVSQTHDIWM